MKIKLKDNSEVEVKDNISAIEFAKGLSEGLARNAMCAKVNGKVEDLRHELKDGDKVEIMTFDSQEGKEAFWHTSSHIMAYAISRLYKDVKFAIGPAIEEGFYYDFDLEHRFSEEDYEKIEAEMKKIIKENPSIERFELDIKEAKELMKDQPYKIELIEEIQNNEPISFYKIGDFVDLCKGPHLMEIKNIKAIKLLKHSGAYWRGDEKNKMLQRIYAITFQKKSELDNYMEILEDRKERDHRKIGKAQDLFMTNQLIGSGLPIYLPNGATIRRELEHYIQDKELRLNYNHVYSPSLANVELYKVSGHWDHYKEDMFPAMKMDNEELVLRPMNCPHHMLVYKNKMHSYKDLPIRIGELAADFRYEDSGAVCGLERVRQMCQNDAHIFATHSQIKEVVAEVVQLILDVYKDFNIVNYSFRLSLRDKEDKTKYFDNDEMWENAENTLRRILDDMNIEYYEAIGEAAFYGPKLDVQIKTAIGHDITLSTCQLDFLLPERFELEYIDENGEKQRPVVIHRAILGTFDRFLAYIIEEYKGAFPLWLSPLQVKVLPISDKFNDYAKKIEKELRDENVRVEVDDRQEKIGYKIREAQLLKIPYMLIVGEQEEKNNSVSVRKRKEGDIGTVSLEEMKEKILKEIKNKEIM